MDIRILAKYPIINLLLNGQRRFRKYKFLQLDLAFAYFIVQNNIIIHDLDRKFHISKRRNVEGESLVIYWIELVALGCGFHIAITLVAPPVILFQ